MSKLSIKDEFFNKIDFIEEEDALSVYRPNKAKKVQKEELFNDDSYIEINNKFSKIDEGNTFSRKVKIILIIMLLVILGLIWLIIYQYF